MKSKFFLTLLVLIAPFCYSIAVYWHLYDTNSDEKEWGELKYYLRENLREGDGIYVSPHWAVWEARIKLPGIPFRDSRYLDNEGLGIYRRLRVVSFFGELPKRETGLFSGYKRESHKEIGPIRIDCYAIQNPRNAGGMAYD